MESCPTQFGQEGKGRDMVGCSLREEKDLLVYILRETNLCQKSKEKSASREDGN